ncbi:MAG: GNAT family N-acetyltransferase [SAR202 cluster bacterium]|nr:GNAT family N-acetyltransferase [SAR202 cluster bacterium]|tara:strand:+ start:521 stop:1018 length:498 start_codon:yes stop_codon:yes gene_type:complete
MPGESKIKIRAATAADVALVLQFVRGLADYERLSDEVVATEANLHESFFGPDANAEAVFADHDDGGPVGMAVFCRHYSTYSGRNSLYLEDIFVLPEWRGHGVGRQLMAYGAALAKERGYPRMEWSVLDWNEPAIGFYENLGARKVDGWLTYRLTGEPLERLAPPE